MWKIRRRSTRSFTRVGNSPNPRLASPHLSLVSPLTPGGLSTIRSLLQSAKKPTADVYEPQNASAAVLIPLCNVDGKPGVLLEVRDNLMADYSHPESLDNVISFPGGKVDDGESPLAAALRETWEETGIPPEQVEILGEIGPAERSLSGLIVRPYVGFVHSKGPRVISSSVPLPSVPLESMELSPTEVADVFHLPFCDLLGPSTTRLREHLFRDIRPYWTVDVSDKVQFKGQGVPESINDNHTRSGDRLEVWGLTGWYLSIFMKDIVEVW